VPHELSDVITPNLTAFDEDNNGARVAVAYSRAGGQAKSDVNGLERHTAASTMKLLVMIEACRQIDAGFIELDNTLPAVNEFTSVEAGAPRFSISQRADADAAMYEYIGHGVTIRFLLERMICYSSNLATNLLLELIDADSLRATIKDLGLQATTVARGIEDLPVITDSLRNRVTAVDLNTTLLAILNHTAASAGSCELMLGYLSRQRLNEEIPAGLPDEVVVAHKTGWLKGVQHDAALIFPPDTPPYALTVLTEDFRDNAAARQLIRQISAIVYANRKEL
jgi:beta-lactamase class A